MKGHQIILISFSIGTIFILILTLCNDQVVTSYEKSRQSSPRDSFVVGAIEVTKSDTEEVEKKTKVRFVGDVMLARNVEFLMDTYGKEYPYLSLATHPSDAYLVGNFESSVPRIHKKTPSMGFTFATKPEYLSALREYGFTHVGIANNHSYDHGKDGFIQTKKELENASLSFFGDQLEQASSSIAFLEIGEESVALIGVYAVDVTPTKTELLKLITTASEKSSVQVAYVHFGTEYAKSHSVFQESLARMLIDLGVEVVVGHHPHVVQDVEVYKGRPIFYSLGNFIFDQYFSEDVQRGLAIEMSMTNEELSFKLLPVTSIGSRSAPRFMSAFEKDVFLADLAKKSDTELTFMIKASEIRVAR